MESRIHGWGYVWRFVSVCCVGAATLAADEPGRSQSTGTNPAAARLLPANRSQGSPAERRTAPRVTEGAPRPDVPDAVSRSAITLSQPSNIPAPSSPRRAGIDGPGIVQAGYDEATGSSGASQPVWQLARQRTGPDAVLQRPVETQQPLTRPDMQQPGPPQSAEVPSFIGNVDVQALDQLGVIILRGNPQDVENMRKIIEEIQRISAGVEPFVRVFQLQRASATQVRDTILELYSGGGGSTTTSRAATTQPGAQPNQPGAATAPGTSGQAAVAIQTPVLKRFQIAADERSNTLMVQASPMMMDELDKLIQRLDVDTAPTVNEVRVFPLKNSEASELANILTQAINAEDPGAILAGAGATTTATATGGQPQVAGRAAVLRFVPLEGISHAVVSGILDEVRVTPQVRTNSIVVSAPESSMELLAAIIDELDRPPQLVADMKVFTLKNSDATNMRQTLAELFDIEISSGIGTAGGFAGGAQNQFQRPIAVAEGNTPPVSIRVAIDARTNSLLVSGPPNALESVEAVIRKIDANDLLARQNQVIRLRNASSTNVATAVSNFFNQKRTVENQIRTAQQQQDLIGAYQRLEQEVVVIAEPVTNSLLISSSPRFFNSVMEMIEQLDRIQDQVMIQVVIARLDLRDDFEFGLELGLQDSLLFDRGATGLPGTGRMPGTPGFNFNSTGPLGNTTVADASSVGGQGLTNLGMGRAGLDSVGGLILAASSESVSALLRALAVKGYVEIISRPSVMTLDGRAARIQVGERVPYSTGPSTSFQTGTADQNVGAGGVSFLDVGVILDVTPTINPDGRVILQIVPEVSEVTEFQTVSTIITSGITVPITAPRVSITLADTVVSVNDGQTVMLGGMIQPREEELVRKVPWLGDLPYVGHLFRYTRNQKTKTELLIILTPHVVRTPEDIQRIKQEELGRMGWAMESISHVHGDVGLAMPIPLAEPELMPHPTQPSPLEQLSLPEDSARPTFEPAEPVAPMSGEEEPPALVHPVSHELPAERHEQPKQTPANTAQRPAYPPRTEAKSLTKPAKPQPDSEKPGRFGRFWRKISGGKSE